MKKNISKNDKIIRIIIGVLLVIAGYYFNIWWLYLIAIVPFLTAFTGYCPLYKNKDNSSPE